MLARLCRLVPFLILLSAAVATAQLATAVKPPQFDEYPAGRAYTGKHHAPILTAENRMYRTRLRDGARQKVNFAGHYVLTLWGCGAYCRDGAAIDVRTGKVFLIPFTLCCWGEGIDEPMDLKISSRLISFIGERDEKEPIGTWYYRIDDTKGWVVVREVPRPPRGQG
jgi:hypothetical protein